MTDDKTILSVGELINILSKYDKASPIGLCDLSTDDPYDCHYPITEKGVTGVDMESPGNIGRVVLITFTHRSGDDTLEDPWPIEPGSDEEKYLEKVQKIVEEEGCQDTPTWGDICSDYVSIGAEQCAADWIEMEQDRDDPREIDENVWGDE